MSLTLGAVITACRDRHPAFHRTRVSDAVFARLFSAYQSELIGRAMQRDRAFLAQQASVVFATDDSNAIGVRGAGTGGYPVTVASDGTVSLAEGTIGDAKELDLSTGTVVVASFVPSSSTTTSATKSGAGWTVNAYANDTLEVTDGSGATQRRAITSNTSDTLVWADALTTALDATSVVRVVSQATSVPQDFGVVAGFPTTASRVGYLTKLDATGAPYIDLTTPLVGTVAEGIALPPMKHLIGGTVWLQDDATKTNPYALTLVTYQGRHHRSGSWFAAYVMGNTLYLEGDAVDWANVASIDLRYVPEPSAFTATTDYFLLPDAAQPALVAHGAYMAGLRVQGLEGLPPLDLGALATAKQTAETLWLQTVSAQPRATMNRVIERW